jgi:hypothetical protein
MTSQLLTDVLRGIRAAKKPVPEIARGAGVETRWLRYVVAGDVADPGAAKLEKVLRYLRETEKAA